MLAPSAPVASLPLAQLAVDVRLIAGAAVLMTMAFAALALFTLRRRSRELALLSFTAFATLYAIRLLASTRTIPDLLGGSTHGWMYGRAMLTYVMPVPLLLLAEQVLGPGWRGVHRWLRWLAIVFAIAAIGGALLLREPWWASPANRLFVLLLLATLALPFSALKPAARMTPAVRATQVCVMVAAFFVVAENLRDMGIWSWPSDLEFVGFVALAVSMAYSLAERYLANESRLVSIERELHTAREIQQSILPRDVPAGDGFRVAVRYLPMTAVAGDFYDFFVMSGGAPGPGVLVADVSGHGVPAALIASMVKVAASSHKQDISEPGCLLAHVNRTLDGQLGGQFVTAMCLHVDRLAGIAACAGAGHPPMLHWRAASRTLEKIDSTGVMLGVLPAADYGTVRQPIAAGDRLVLYTDGLIEATRIPANGSASPDARAVAAARGGAAGTEEEMFGDLRFPALIREHAARPGSELAELILADLTRWSGRTTGFDDDVTLVIVDVL